MLFGKDALEMLGILDGINEVIATTEKDGRINAAPLGIIRNEESLYIRLFNGSHTYDNILSNKWFVGNITHDSWLFAESALGDLSQDYFVRREGLPVLKDAESWALFKCEAFPLDIVNAEVELVKGEIQEKKFRAFNRGANLVVEASIAATRYMALRSDSYYKELLKLRMIIDRCGGPREREAIDRLMNRIDSYSHI
ncbi:MAG: DUF447 family protein [Methanotrichaceae archaeon]|nr:DUF447 family protein [Methanotrichaceae archaeon]